MLKRVKSSYNPNLFVDFVQFLSCRKKFNKTLYTVPIFSMLKRVKSSYNPNLFVDFVQFLSCRKKFNKTLYTVPIFSACDVEFKVIDLICQVHGYCGDLITNIVRYILDLVDICSYLSPVRDPALKGADFMLIC